MLEKIWKRAPKPRTVTADESVGILYICTGKYVVFWEQFYRSMEKKFLPGMNVDYYVFTDADRVYCEEHENVHRVYQKLLGWPYDTLKRFDMFLGIEDRLKNYDYLYFFNSNCYICKTIRVEEFLPTQGEQLVFTQHPGMHDKTNTEFTYERDERSRAYIPMGEGRVYVAGGLNGGRTDAFLAMAHVLSKRIQDDEADGIIAIYHDESQINRYVYELSNYKLLHAGFCYPEGWKMPFEKRVLILDKSKFFNDRKLKEEGNQRNVTSSQKAE